MSRVIELHGGRRDCDIMVIRNYIYKQCLSPLKLWGVLDTTLSDKGVSDLRQIGVFSRYSGFLHQ